MESVMLKYKGVKKGVKKLTLSSVSHGIKGL